MERALAGGSFSQKIQIGAATVLGTFTSLRDEAGAPNGFVAVTVDVTEHETAELALHESEARLTQAQRMARLGWWEWMRVRAHRRDGSNFELGIADSVRAWGDPSELPQVVMKLLVNARNAVLERLEAEQPEPRLFHPVVTTVVLRDMPAAGGAASESCAVQIRDNGAGMSAELRRARYDLVLLDVNMPALSGWEVLNGLLSVRADQAVVMISGYALEREAIERGARGLVQKPFNGAVLRQAVADALLQRAG